MSRRFSSISGFASWLGNRPSISKQSVVARHARRSNNRGATRPAMPLPASSTTLNGLTTAGSMNAITWSTYASRALRLMTFPGRAAGAGTRPFAIMSRMSEMPASPLSGRASFPTIFMPLYCFGLCEAVISTPPSCASRATAK
jgi:hypothetical protein